MSLIASIFIIILWQCYCQWYSVSQFLMRVVVTWTVCISCQPTYCCNFDKLDFQYSQPRLSRLLGYQDLLLWSQFPPMLRPVKFFSSNYVIKNTFASKHKAVGISCSRMSQPISLSSDQPRFALFNFWVKSISSISIHGLKDTSNFLC